MESTIESLKESYKNIKNDIAAWGKTFLAELKVITVRKAVKAARSIDTLEKVSPVLAIEYDAVVDSIESLKPESDADTKVSTNRKRRTRKKPKN
ncbi:hypothetical protein MTCD1_03707 [Colwellia marinimaniae]|uniref:Uncharacterized protein n=2 Tax=Colwellia marinimaniae TaxID=1513592 RepID=A0ABQ0N098_9GAMM|nr:hypothetical protein MTCD1_03707 [Colwellia marinimaniae]